MIFSTLYRTEDKQKAKVQFEWLLGDTSLDIAEVCIMIGI